MIVHLPVAKMVNPRLISEILEDRRFFEDETEMLTIIGLVERCETRMGVTNVARKVRRDELRLLEKRFGTETPSNVRVELVAEVAEESDELARRVFRRRGREVGERRLSCRERIRDGLTNLR